MRAPERPLLRLAGNRTSPPEASGNTPDSGSVPGIASVEVRGQGFSLALLALVLRVPAVAISFGIMGWCGAGAVTWRLRPSDRGPAWYKPA